MPALPVPGAMIWIRQVPWRVEHARRDREVVRLDVAGRGRQTTFLVPFDLAAAPPRTSRLRTASARAALARLAGIARHIGGDRVLSAPVDADVRILPHQLEPALAILTGARRVLIADAVGLGKTIQAGLILAELLRRDRALRALVVVPASLRDQWRDELDRRFRIAAMSGDAATVERVARSVEADDNPWRRTGIWIASLDYLKQPHVLAALPRLPWDVIVIDEAHGACGDSERHEAASRLARSSRRVVLLTATPHNGDDTRFSQLLDLGRLPVPDDDILVFRRGRSDVADGQPGTGRRVHWHQVPLSTAEVRLLEVLAAFERAVLQAAGKWRRDAALLLLSVFRKRALSTTAALRRSVDRRLAALGAADGTAGADWLQPRLPGVEDDSDAIGDDERAAASAVVGLDVRRERSWLQRLQALADAAVRDESKIRCVESLLRRSREPVVVFTEFKDSLDAVQRRLASKVPLAVLHGRLSGVEQSCELRRFLDGDARVLIATDVAGQGLNLQSRGRWIVNLELPWNPCRLEQRAGRVDRIGQHRRVHVTLLVARHQAEAGVLSRLARRALSAERAMGEPASFWSAPDEVRLRAHLLAGQPLDDRGEPPRAVAICHRWKRPARTAVRRLHVERALSRAWRGPRPAGLPRIALSRRKGAVKPGWLLFFSVPIVDGAGLQVERPLVCVRVHAGAAPVQEGHAVLETASAAAIRHVRPRARRIARTREALVEQWMTREAALWANLPASNTLDVAQPGLFDRRGLRAFASLQDEARETGGGLSTRLAFQRASAAVEAAAPVLELVFTNCP